MNRKKVIKMNLFIESVLENNQKRLKIFIKFLKQKISLV